MAGRVQRIGVQQRRARLVRRHRLARVAAAAGPLEVARDLVGLHGTDPATVYLSIAARIPAVDIEAISRALYDDRTLVRILGMRRTVFVLPVDLAGVVQAACARAIAVVERRKMLQLVHAVVADDPAGWLDELGDVTVRALAVRGEATVAELTADEPRLAHKLLLAVGKSYQGQQSVGSRLLFVLAADGRIVRGRPRGSWLSTQYRWSPTERWLPGGLPDWPTEAARVELVRRWLARFGPGTAADLRWWTGWPAGQVTSALAQLAPAEVDLDGGTGYLLADDADPVPAAAAAAVLLPALDPTPMGWSQRDWYLGGPEAATHKAAEHRAALFDRNGNIGPTVWWDGRIIGGWAQRGTGEIGYRLLEDVGAEAVTAVAAAADRLAGWLGDLRVTPRFRTPLERELVG